MWAGPALGIMRPGAIQKNEAFYLKKKKKKSLKNYSTYGFFYKITISIFFSIFSNKYCSIDNIVNPFNLSCDIVDRK
jgi:hypothetical protein